jgi:hypothetical protein
MKINRQKQLNRTMMVCAAMLLSLISCTRQDVTVWVASPWQHVLRSTPPGEQREAVLKAAGNEYEPFRLIIHNSGNLPLNNLTVGVSSLKNGNDEISAENISLYRAHYLHVTEPSRRNDKPAGWYPDALIPFSVPESGRETEKPDYVAAPFHVDTGQNAEVWCDLFVPPGKNPGIYHGTVTIRAGGIRLARVPVHLTVWDFELPEKMTLVTQLGALHRNSMKMMGIEEGTGEFEKMESLLLETLNGHRVKPRTPSYAWPEWNEQEGIIDKGEAELMKVLVEDKHCNALGVPFRYKDDPGTCKAYLSAVAEWLEDLGYLDISFIHLKDEPNDAEAYELVRKQGALIESAAPGIARRCTEQTKPTREEWGDLYGAVDIWCPLWGNWNQTTARERLDKGETMWSYTALCQGPDGTPWWEIDTDPLNFRSPYWLAMLHDITGIFYWSSTCWSPYETLQGAWEKPHFRDQFWGEGLLLYPGQPAGTNGFVPSIRLKLIRESMEDYEYMIMAAENNTKDAVISLVKGVVQDFQHWSHEREDYEEARGQLAGMIIP